MVIYALRSNILVIVIHNMSQFDFVYPYGPQHRKYISNHIDVTFSNLVEHHIIATP